MQSCMRRCVDLCPRLRKMAGGGEAVSWLTPFARRQAGQPREGVRLTDIRAPSPTPPPTRHSNSPVDSLCLSAHQPFLLLPHVTQEADSQPVSSHARRHCGQLAPSRVQADRRPHPPLLLPAPSCTLPLLVMDWRCQRRSRPARARCRSGSTYCCRWDPHRAVPPASTQSACWERAARDSAAPARCTSSMQKRRRDWISLTHTTSQAAATSSIMQQ